MAKEVVVSCFDPWADDQGPRGRRARVPKGLSEDGLVFDPFGTDAGAGSQAVSFLESEPSSGLPGDALRQSPVILTVCTGNICRSPFFERVLSAGLKGAGVSVESAGTEAVVGDAMDPGAATLLQEMGIGSEGFLARQLTAEMVARADLVLVATREHRRAVVSIVPSALGRTFTLIDFADLCRGLDLSSSGAHGGREELRALVRRAARRRHLVPPRMGDSADVADPFRRGASAFREMGEQSRESLEIITHQVGRALGLKSR